MPSSDLRDIPWFAFDTPEYGTPNRKPTNQRLTASNAFAATDSPLSGWDMLQRLVPLAVQPLKPTTRLKPQGPPGNTTPATEFRFNHHEDISQYMRDYRAYHTHKQTGSYGSYNEISRRSRPGRSTPCSSVDCGGSDNGDLPVDDVQTEAADGDSNTVTGYSRTPTDGASLKHKELLHILRHRSKHLKLPARPGDGKRNEVEPGEGEDDSREALHDSRWQRSNKLLRHRPSSSGSVHSVSETCARKRVPSSHGKPSSAGLDNHLYRRLKTEHDLYSNRRATQTVDSQSSNQALAGQTSSHSRQIPGPQFFVGSSLKRSPQNGLPSSPNQKYRNSILRSSQASKLLKSTHSTIATLKHQVWFDDQGRAYVSLTSQLNALFKSQPSI